MATRPAREVRTATRGTETAGRSSDRGPRGKAVRLQLIPSGAANPGRSPPSGGLAERERAVDPTAARRLERRLRPGLAAPPPLTPTAPERSMPRPPVHPS